jgi:hypothetical protein
MTDGVEKIVYIVHCVDAEGPLRESLEASFERLKDIFGIDLPPSAATLRKIQRKEMDLGKDTDLIASVFAPHLLDYNDSWEKIDLMLGKIMSEDFRNGLKDSFGGGWVYNWFCLDHIGYEHNPRERDVGYHKIYDFYFKALQKYNSVRDGLHWHFHPMSFYREAHRCATSYVCSPHLYEVLCRRIIERNCFPAAFRAGFQAERPDSNWFLEQWIPFDFSNWAYKNKAHDTQLDLSNGRSGDWRLAPDDWSVYHPSPHSWQLPGTCNRWVARCIDILTRGRELALEEVVKAFARADSGLPTIMAFNNHDFRDMGYEIDCVREKIVKASKMYPNVKFKFSEGIEAFRSVVYDKNEAFAPIDISISIEGDGRRRLLKVDTVSGRVFGPQPFLAVKTKTGRFAYDNFDFDTSLSKWSYTFDNDSIRADDLERVGIAANDKYGNTVVKVIDI